MKNFILIWFLIKCLIALGTHPSIAQLAERETVEAKQLSLGHWFESGWTETFFKSFRMSNGGLPRPSLASSASPGINSSGSRFNESILAQDDAQDTPKSRQRVQNDTRYCIGYILVSMTFLYSNLIKEKTNKTYHSVIEPFTIISIKSF